MAEVKQLGKIEGLGKIVVCYAPFDEQLKALRKAGAKYPISVRDAAYMRLHGGSTDGTRTCHAPIYAKNSPIILAMLSPLVKNLRMAEKAVEANKNDQYFVTEDTEIYDKYAKIAEQDKNIAPEKRNAIFLPEKGDYLIKSGSEETKAIFKDTEKEYFGRFAENGVTFHPSDEDFVDEQKGTTISYLWFWSSGGSSDLSSDDRGLDCDSRAFGVLSETGEASSRAKLHYTKEQLDKNLEILKQVRTGNLPASKLEKALEFFEMFKK